MTHTIHADLLTEQKTTAYPPYLAVSIEDNNLPHPAEQIAHPMTNYSGLPAAACYDSTNDAIVRAHISGGDLFSQRITDPTDNDQWTAAWTSRKTGKNYPALFFTDGTTVLAYQTTSSGAVQYIKSTDGGSSWSAYGSIWTPAYSLNGLQYGMNAPGETDRAGLLHVEGTSVCFRRYDKTADSFAAATTYDTGKTVNSLAGLYDGSKYVICYVVEDYNAWASSAIIIQTLNFDGSSYTWGTPALFLGLQGGGGDSPAYAYGHLAASMVDGNYWLSFYASTDTDEGALFDDGDHIISLVGRWPILHRRPEVGPAERGGPPRPAGRGKHRLPGERQPIDEQPTTGDRGRAPGGHRIL